MSRNFFSLITLTAVLLGISGCAGYKIGETKPSVYSHIHKIYVPTFKNDTLEPRAAVLVTNSVIKEILQDGSYQIVSSKENADAELKGTIMDVERRQLRGSQTDTLKTTEMSLFIVVAWGLYDTASGTKLEYSEARDLNDANIDKTSNLRVMPGRVVGQTIQFVDPNFQLSERNALPVAAEDAARQLVGQLAEGL